MYFPSQIFWMIDCGLDDFGSWVFRFEQYIMRCKTCNENVYLLFVLFLFANKNHEEVFPNNICCVTSFLSNHI